MQAIETTPTKGRDAAMRKKILYNTFAVKLENAEKDNVIEI